MGGVWRLNSNEKYKKYQLVDVDLWFEPSEEDFELIFNFLNKNEKLLISDIRSTFITINGGQTKEVFDKIASLGYNVVWKGYKGPKLARFLSLLIPASYFGLIKLDHFNDIKKLSNYTSKNTSISIFSIDNSHENEFIRNMMKGDWDNDEENYVLAQDSTFLQIIIDKDNFETDGGSLCIIRHGIECHLELKKIANRFGDIGYLGANK